MWVLSSKVGQTFVMLLIARGSISTFACSTSARRPFAVGIRSIWSNSNSFSVAPQSRELGETVAVPLGVVELRDFVR